jgi:dihydropteroate synthase
VVGFGNMVVLARKERGALLMGVLNTTPDSFSDGGRYSAVDKARARVDELAQEGCDVLDVGAESTRPGSTRVSCQEQLDRAGPVIEYAVKTGAVVSIDTGSPAVARAALGLGARVVNDVTCLGDVDLAKACVDGKADLIIMHSRGSMTAMPGFSHYEARAYRDVVADISNEWRAAEARAIACGLDSKNLWFDPGLGFHKNAEHCAEVMRRLSEFRGLGAGIVLGASRKSFIGSLDGSPPERRLGGSIAACLLGLHAGVSVLRVHDVHEARQALLAARSWQPQQSKAEALYA